MYVKSTQTWFTNIFASLRLWYVISWYHTDDVITNKLKGNGCLIYKCKQLWALRVRKIISSEKLPEVVGGSVCCVFHASLCVAEVFVCISDKSKQMPTFRWVLWHWSSTDIGPNAGKNTFPIFDPIYTRRGSWIQISKYRLTLWRSAAATHLCRILLYKYHVFIISAPSCWILRFHLT